MPLILLTLLIVSPVNLAQALAWPWKGDSPGEEVEQDVREFSSTTPKV